MAEIPTSSEVKKETQKPEEGWANLNGSPEKAWEKLKKINTELQKQYISLQSNRQRVWNDKTDSDGSHDERDRKSVEERLALQENEFKTKEWEYQWEMARILTDVKGKFPTPNHPKIEQKWLDKSITDLHYATEPLDESRVQFLAKTFPQAWKGAIVDPNMDLSSNKELAVVRERIQGKLRFTEQEIFKNSSWLTPEEITKRLAENFQKVTGIVVTPESFKKYVAQQVDSSPVDKNWKDTSAETFGPSATRWFSAGWSSDVPSADNGARDIPPVEASEMTIDTYQWQWSWFKMRWPLKDLPKDTKWPPSLLAKLAKQGTNPGWSTGTCYKSVKNHLCAAGYVDSSYKMTQWSAQNAASDLQNIWFSNVWPNIWNAQPGDVCVYSGWAHGHIEIKTDGWFASDFFSNNASGRKLIGVWRPPA